MSGYGDLWTDYPLSALVYQRVCVMCGNQFVSRQQERVVCYGCAPVPDSLIPGAHPDTPSTTTVGGGKHALIEADYTQLDGPAISRVAEVMYHGSEKYGRDNWRAIPEREHINHAMMHIYAHNAGDTQDDHLEHALTRLMMALAVALRPGYTGEFTPEGV